MPATEKARSVVDRLSDKARRLKVQNFPKQELSLEGLSSDQRTSFFIDLMRGLKDYSLQTVVAVKCAAETDDESDPEIELDEEDTDAEITGKIANVALSGLNLLQSEECQALKRKGFFITAVTWRSMQNASPQHLFKFAVSFDEPRQGVGFKFDVRVAHRLPDGTLANQFKPLEPALQPGLWAVVEATSTAILERLRTTPASFPGSPNPTGS